MNHLMPSLVSVSKIDGAPARSQFPADSVEEAAQAILDAQALVSPLVVKQTGIDSFTLVDGALAFHAVSRARELDPRRVEKVLAFIAVDGQEAALTRQQAILRQGPGAAPTAPAPSSADSGISTRFDNFEVDLRAQFEGLKRQLSAERQALEQQMSTIATRMPRKLDPLDELNHGDARAVADLLALAGLKGKSLEKVVQLILAERPYQSLSDVAKRTRGLSADRLLGGIEQWLLISRNQP